MYAFTSLITILQHYSHYPEKFKKAWNSSPTTISFQVVLAENEETAAVQGYGIFRKDRILALYAESTEIAHAIMQKMLQASKHDKVYNILPDK